jgi:hypothetical protein
MRNLAIAVQAAYVLSFPGWYVISLFSVMLFDDPNAERFWPAHLLYFGIQSYPYVTIAAIAASWLLYRKRRLRAFAWMNAIPVMLALISLLPMLMWEDFHK